MASPVIPLPPTGPSIFRPVYLVPTLGEYALLPDGAIVNIGGVVGPTFTVGGKALLFADGTTTDGSSTGLSVDLQRVYENSVGEAFIDFTSNKDFVLQAVNDKQFRFDADTGNVTIGGNLVVQGTTSTVINSVVNTDRVEIHQTAGTYVPFLIEPASGVVPGVAVVDIKVASGGASVFTISPTGETYIQDLTVGSVNGIDLNALVADITNHLAPTGIKHSAEQISADTSALAPITGDTVQEAFESIAAAINNLSTSGGTVKAHEHVQLVPAKTWTIVHGQNTRKVQLTVWDNTDEMMYADSTHIEDANTIVITYNTPVTGRAILMLF